LGGSAREFRHGSFDMRGTVNPRGARLHPPYVGDFVGHRMRSDPATQTTTALLTALADPSNEQAWHALLDRCEPILRGVATRLGVPRPDVDDVVQATLSTFVDAWRRGQYDRSRGRLSSFLVTILRSRVLDLRRSRANRLAAAADDFPEELVDAPGLERFWMDERRYQILLAAIVHLRADRVDARALEAFELTALRGTPVPAVAEQLDMTVEQVHVARHRISRRLRPIAARIDESWEDL